jgi:hypothetical protein
MKVHVDHTQSQGFLATPELLRYSSLLSFTMICPKRDTLQCGQPNTRTENPKPRHPAPDVHAQTPLPAPPIAIVLPSPVRLAGVYLALVLGVPLLARLASGRCRCSFGIQLSSYCMADVVARSESEPAPLEVPAAAAFFFGAGLRPERDLPAAEGKKVLMR